MEITVSKTVGESAIEIIKMTASIMGKGGKNTMQAFRMAQEALTPDKYAFVLAIGTYQENDRNFEAALASLRNSR